MYASSYFGFFCTFPAYQYYAICTTRFYNHTTVLYNIKVFLNKQFKKIVENIPFFEKKLLYLYQIKELGLYAYIILECSSATNKKILRANRGFLNSIKKRVCLADMQLQAELVGDHCDKFRVCRLAAAVVYGIAKVGIERINVASVPRYLNCVAYSPFNP